MTLSSDFIRYCRLSWFKSALYRFTLMRGEVPKHLTVTPTDPWPGDSQAGRLLLEGKFAFGNHIIEMTDLWLPKEVDATILADLHRFTWLRDLRAVGDNAARRLARQLISNWIERNQDWHLMSWNVDITGPRIANWIALYDFFCASADESFRSLFFKEITRQVQHLRYHWSDASTALERFFALKGLLYAAATFPGEAPRLADLISHLETEVQAQLWPDGGHKSRCPHIHLVVLQDLIDIRAMLRLVHHEIPSFLQTTISQMAPIVRLFRHGDGGLATFGNVSAIPSPVIDMILSLADVRGRPPERALTLGFERCVNKNSLLLLNVGGSIQSAHHPVSEKGTGSLNFEWSLGRTRLVVQGDIILQTQAGEAYQASGSIEPKALELYRMSKDGHTLLDVAYTHQGILPYTHRRQLCLGGKQSHLKGEDTIQVASDSFYGIRFVLDQGMKASLISGGRGVLIHPIVEQDVPAKEKPHWRLLISGAEEIICEPYAGSAQAILVLGQAQKNEPASIQWAFCLE